LLPLRTAQALTMLSNLPCRQSETQRNLRCKRAGNAEAHAVGAVDWCRPEAGWSAGGHMIPLILFAIAVIIHGGAVP
jgi:hypothetical protein